MRDKKINRLGLELSTQIESRRLEETRLWEIIEKYRIESQALNKSWILRAAKPLRVIKRAIQDTPSVIKKKIFGLFKLVLYRLSPENKLRRKILRTYEYVSMFLLGAADNDALRASHASIIKSRKQLLGSKPELENLPDIDISVVTHNSAGWVDQFYKSLCSQDYPLSKISIVFVDNGSTDETVLKLEKLDWSSFASKDVVLSENLGFGTGHNKGTGLGKNDFVLVSNIDLEYQPDSLTKAVSFAFQDDVDVASWELRQMPYEHPKFYDPVSLQTGWSSHACILFRRKVFEMLGGYEEKIFMYGEDVEFSYRTRASGYKLRYLPQAVVAHHTYERPGEIKSLQYQGSTLANAYIRLRYGSKMDVLRIFSLYLRLLLGNPGIENNGRIVKKNIASIIRNCFYFLRSRKTNHSFPFRDWDYDIVRDGAFYKSPKLQLSGPLVTVVTRTYKGREALLRECMQSVAHQTYENVEHVIVEDGGDTMALIVKSFMESYPDANISYYPLEKLGRCLAGNRGLEVSSGEYLLILDDDDLLFSDHIEVCLGELLADRGLSGVYSLSWEVATNFISDHYEERSHGTPDTFRQEFDRDILKHHNFIPIQSLLFKRSLFEEYGGFDPELINLEDWNLWLRYSKTKEFKLISKTTSMFRTPWSLAERSRRQDVLDSYLKVARKKNASV